MRRKDEIEALQKVARRASEKVAEIQQTVNGVADVVTNASAGNEAPTTADTVESALGHGDAAVVMPGPAEAADAELNDEQGAAREAVSNGSCECGGGSFVFRIPLFFSLAFFSLFVVMLGSFKPIVRASSSVVAWSQPPLEASTLFQSQLGSVGVGRDGVGFDDVGLDVGAGLGVVVNATVSQG